MKTARFHALTGSLLSLLLAFHVRLAVSAEEKPTLYIVGDSTVKNNTPGQRGWGDPIAGFFDRSKIVVANHAIGGRSSRTFQTEGRWQRILDRAKPGDFVLIQMGHNDGGKLNDDSRARGSIPGLGEETEEIDNLLTRKQEIVHTYGWYLRKYITDARARGMTPILCTPVPRLPRAKVEPGQVENNGHVRWSREVARNEHVLLVDLNTIILSHYAGLEPTEIKARYFTPADNTHTSPAGADLNALCVAEGLKSLKECPLTPYLLERPDSARSSKP